jgi:hypothetical protein
LIGLASASLDVAEKAEGVGFAPALGRPARHVERLLDRAERIVQASGAQVRRAQIAESPGPGVGQGDSSARVGGASNVSRAAIVRALMSS